MIRSLMQSQPITTLVIASLATSAGCSDSLREKPRAGQLTADVDRESNDVSAQLGLRDSRPKFAEGFVFYPQWRGALALDRTKALALDGSTEPLTFANLINTRHGITGVLFRAQGFDSYDLDASDFVFQQSPQGVFSINEQPPEGWSRAPAPQSISASGTPGLAGKIVLKWAPSAIEGRWLRITIAATSKTGLKDPKVFYLGHLTGEMTGPENGVFSVSATDSAALKNLYGQTADESNPADLSKNGLVDLADLKALQANFSKKLTNFAPGASQCPEMDPKKTIELDISFGKMEFGNSSILRSVENSIGSVALEVDFERTYQYSATEVGYFFLAKKACYIGQSSGQLESLFGKTPRIVMATMKNAHGNYFEFVFTPHPDNPEMVEMSGRRSIPEGFTPQTFPGYYSDPSTAFVGGLGLWNGPNLGRSRIDHRSILRINYEGR